MLQYKIIIKKKKTKVRRDRRIRNDCRKIKWFQFMVTKQSNKLCRLVKGETGKNQL